MVALFVPISEDRLPIPPIPFMRFTELVGPIGCGFIADRALTLSGDDAFRLPVERAFKFPEGIASKVPEDNALKLFTLLLLDEKLFITGFIIMLFD